jgi:hypothetical protein
MFVKFISTVIRNYFQCESAVFLVRRLRRMRTRVTMWPSQTFLNGVSSVLQPWSSSSGELD